MKKQLYFFNTFFLLLSVVTFSQIKIGDNPTTIGTSSALELESTNKALVITRVPNTASITTPVNGMLVYDLSSNCIKGYQNGTWSECIGSNPLSDSVLAQIGNEGDSPNVVHSVVTVAQINTISPAITGAIVGNQTAYQAYIDANPSLFSAPATAAEVQAMVNAVNANQSLLADIGTDADNGNNALTSAVVAADYNALPNVSGAIAGNNAAYLAYIAANAAAFSSPATTAQVQAMVTAVNASQTVLAQIGNEGDSPNTVASVVTVAQINTISPAITGAIVANQTAYQAYIDANPNLFSAPATAAEVQAMVNAVNANQSLLANIGTDADNGNNAHTSAVVAADYNALPNVSGAIAGNNAAYLAYIAANAAAFSSPATAAQVQTMITAVNASQSVLAQIGNEGDSPNTVASVVTVAQINTISPAITGAIVGNQTAYQAYIDANPSLFSAPATAAEVQAMVNAVNANQSLLANIGTDADNGNNALTSAVVAADYNALPNVSGAIAGNNAAYLAYIAANAAAFSSPATTAQVQTMITTVNASQSVLAQIGNEGDSPNTVASVVTVAQINTISPAITGAIVGNQTAYQAYIDANPSLFSAPATAAEVQAMVNAVNANQSLLANIGTDADNGNNALTSAVVAADYNALPNVSGAIAGNNAAYLAYIAANAAAFSSPATTAEVQAMVNAVNASQSVLAQIGNEGDSPNTVASVVTVAQINTISPAITGAIVGNQTAYQAYIDANPSLFASPATAAEVQAMVTAVNTSQTVLAQIGNEGDSPNTVASVVTVAQINTISPAITGAIVGNQTAYQAYIDANPSLFASPATAAEVQAMVTAVNTSQSVLAQIGNEGDSPNTVASVVTVAQINTISPAITGAIVGNQTAYQAYIDANPSLFASPATAAEVQAMVTAVNASQSVLAQIGNEGDSPNTVASVVTVAQINTISPAITGAIVGNQTAYQAYIDANPNLFSAPATAAEVQAMVTAVNASQSVLAQIGNEGDSPNTVASVVTVAQINTISPAITGAIVANQTAYQAYIDANPNLFSAPATAAEVQAMVNAVNANQSLLANIGTDADNGNNALTSAVVAADYNALPNVSGAIAGNNAAYLAYIAANAAAFSSPATAAQVQTMITAVNASQSVLAQIGNEGDSPNTVASVVTVAQINTISPAITGAIVGNQTAYQAYIDANPNLFSAPATKAEVQAMITTVNASQTVLAQIGNEGDSPNTVASVVTVAQINTISPAITGAIVANQTAYQAYIDANPNLFSAPATAVEVQTMITAVNASQSVLAQIGNEGDSPNVVPSVVTAVQINTISPAITGVNLGYTGNYRLYIDANPNLFSAPATVAEVQAMVTLLNLSVPTSGGSAVISTINNCSTFSNGSIYVGTPFTGVTQTITVTVASIGSYNISTDTVNGFYFKSTGTFTSTGVQTISFVALGGPPSAVGTFTYTLPTTPSCSFSRTTSPVALPANIVLGNTNPYFIASIYDQDYAPYSLPTSAATLSTAQSADGVNEAITIDIQGTLTTTGVTIDIPYTVTTSAVNLPAYTQTITIPAAYTQDGNSRDVTFSYSAATYPVGSGKVPVTLKAVGGTLNIKKLDLQTGLGNDNLGWLLAQFTYATNSVAATNNFALRAITGIPDRNIANNNYVMLYLPVTGADGKVWLNNNLGADYANTAKTSFFNPSQQATSETDFHAFGSLVQWGRYTDVHDLINWTSATVATPVNGTTTTLSTTDTPSSSSFITNSIGNADWRNPQNDNLWQGVIGINNPCPKGFRVPTTTEYTNLISTSGITTSTNAATSALKFTTPGYRFLGNGTIATGVGDYYTSTINGAFSNIYSFTTGGTTSTFFNRANGCSVRCIQDTTPLASVSAINCGGATTSGFAAYNTVTSGVTTTVPYTGGNGGVQYGQSVTSTGVTGLTATLAASVLASGSGNLSFTITGTPTSFGTATFAITLGGQSCSFGVNVLAAAPLPANITLGAISPYFIASAFDTDYLPYTLPVSAATLSTLQPANGSSEAVTINVQGSLTTTGVTINIPYTVTGSSVTLPAFSRTITIPASYTEDGISRDITFSYSAATYGVGTGNVPATLKSVGGTLNAKKLDIQTGIGNNFLGWLLGQFIYSINNSGGTATFEVRNIAAIPDRNITNSAHVMFYFPVTGPDGRVWLNNNLGANYANTTKSVFNPIQQATSATDFNAYGSLFQWGRYSDGHELVNWTGSTSGTMQNSSLTAQSTTDTPGHSLIIGNTTSWWDWRSPSNDNLWKGVSGINNPCPLGFRLPTIPEYVNLNAAGITGLSQAFSSNLKVSAPGIFTAQNFLLSSIGTLAYYATYSTVNGQPDQTNPIVFYDGGWIYISNYLPRFHATAVRCIKD